MATVGVKGLNCRGSSHCVMWSLFRSLCGQQHTRLFQPDSNEKQQLGSLGTDSLDLSGQLPRYTRSS